MPINFAFNAQYTPLEFDTLTSRYLCASDSTEIKYVFAGQWPVDMLYRKNGGSLETFNLLSGEASSVTNGAYYFSHLRDNAGCVDSVKLNKLIDNQPIQFQIDSITPDCELKLHEITLSTRGTSPWYLFYNYENQTDTLLLSDTLTRWKTSPGDYNFLYVRDADGCDLNIAQRDTLPPFIGFSPHLETDFKAVQVQASDLRHAWYYNELLIDTSSKTSIPVRGDGTYYVVITDSAGCRYTSDSLLFDYPDQISLYPNPAGEQVTVLVQENYGEFWNYQLTDSRGFTVTEGFVETPLKTLDIGHLSTGTYTIRITFSIDGGKNKKILRLLKR